MSEQEFYIERCAGLTVYVPIKKQAEVIYTDWFRVEWESAAQRLTQRGEAITFYREVEERRAA